MNNILINPKNAAKQDEAPCEQLSAVSREIVNGVSSQSAHETYAFIGDITVKPWLDGYVDNNGHDPRSQYVERYWLGILGPASIWFLRRCAWYFDGSPDGFVLSPVEWASWLGVGRSVGRNSALARVIRRCIDFGMARSAGISKSKSIPPLIHVRRMMPWLTRNQVNRLSPDLSQMYKLEFETPSLPAPLEVMRSQSRKLAVEIVRFTTDKRDIEHQLMNHGFHPSIACETAKWVLSSS